MNVLGKNTEVALRGPVAVLTLRRSAVLNAVDMAFAQELLGTATYLAGHPGLRVVVVRGEGRAFCAGIDLKELSAGQLPFEFFEVWERALRTFETMDKIVVAAMHGYALGGGLQLALAADVRASTPSCMFGLPAVKESLVPGLSPWRLPRVIGLGRCRELIVSGRNVDGCEARAMGLVDQENARPAGKSARSDIAPAIVAHAAGTTTAPGVSKRAWASAIAASMPSALAIEPISSATQTSARCGSSMSNDSPCTRSSFAASGAASRRAAAE